MLERFLSQQQPDCVTLAREKGTWHLTPKDTDISVTEQMCQLLEPTIQLTDALASETPVMSAIMPVLVLDQIDILAEKDRQTLRDDRESHEHGLFH